MQNQSLPPASHPVEIIRLSRQEKIRHGWWKVVSWWKFFAKPKLEPKTLGLLMVLVGLLGLGLAIGGQELWILPILIISVVLLSLGWWMFLCS